MTYQVTKTYGHEQGLSCCFRQWRAVSHCNQLHGYAIAVSLVFEADTLDSRNWVVDFGALKPVKEWLQRMFDHTTLVAEDDPGRAYFKEAHQRAMLDLRVVPAVGCEAFATMIYDHVNEWLTEYLQQLAEYGIQAPTNLRLRKVEVREHGANAAALDVLAYQVDQCDVQPLGGVIPRLALEVALSDRYQDARRNHR